MPKAGVICNRVLSAFVGELNLSAVFQIVGKVMKYSVAHTITPLGQIQVV